MIDDTITAYVLGATSEGYAEDWDLDRLWSSLKQLYPIGVNVDDLVEESGGMEGLDKEFLEVQLKEDVHAAYDRREEELGAEVVRELERRVLLEVIDRKWREHLYEMDYLQEGVGLRAYAQRDPLVEYQREGFDMFAQMLEGIKEEAVGFLFNLKVQVEEAPVPEVPEGAPFVPLPESQSHVEIHAKGLGSRTPRALQYSAPTIDGEAGAGGVMIEKEQAPALGIGGTPDGQRRSGPASPTAAGARAPSSGQSASNGPSRNAPCPCGSGKKYKRCHGAPGA
jgi:preprotein translocase subunit SecA